MGIQGLLPFLKKSSVQCNVHQFKGQTVAIDSYCWLHKGAISCAEKLALGEKTDQYVYYCMKYLNMLLSKGIKPIMVFDGCRLPSKQEVEKTRRERRDANRKKAAELLREGRRSEARDCLVQCIDITPLMALELMKACREKGIDCIVAPYEADAQLAYLNKIGIAHFIITEDSDLILFGCDKIFFKMDINGNGILIERDKLNLSFELPMEIYDFQKFRNICILSGCDYLASLPGIGLARATKVFKCSRQTDIRQLIRKLPSILKMPNLVVSEDYIEAFIRAENTFLYQLVYDPIQRSIIPLNSYPINLKFTDLKYAGPYITEERAFQIALGNINVNTGEIIYDFDPDSCGIKCDSIWNRDYNLVKNNLTNKSETNVDVSTHGKQLLVNVPSFKLKHIDKLQYMDMKSNLEHLTSIYTDESKQKIVSPSNEFNESYCSIYNHDKLDHNASKNEVCITYDQSNNCSSINQKKNFPLSPSRKKIRSLSPKSTNELELMINLDNVLTDCDKNGLNTNFKFEDKYIVGESFNKKVEDDALLNKCILEEKENREINTLIEEFSSPKRKNIFAVNKVEDKIPFSLEFNATNQVKSRFFTATKPKQETLFLQMLKEQEGHNLSESIDIGQSASNHTDLRTLIKCKNNTSIEEAIKDDSFITTPTQQTDFEINKLRSQDPISAKLSVFRTEKKIRNPSKCDQQQNHQPNIPLNSTTASMRQFVNVRPKYHSKETNNTVILISDEDPLPSHIKYTCSISPKTPIMEQADLLNFVHLKNRYVDKNKREEKLVILEEDPLPPEKNSYTNNVIREDPLCEDASHIESINYMSESPRGNNYQNSFFKNKSHDKKSTLKKGECRASGLKKLSKNINDVTQGPISQFFHNNFAHKRRSLQFPL